MKKIPWLLFGLLPVMLAAQDKPVYTYYNYQWKECDVSEARFVGVIIKTDSGWLRKDYFLPKRNLQMQGLFKDSATVIKNGSFYYYHSNGMLQSKGVYVNNKKNGTWLEFHSNGAMSDSTEYSHDRVIGISMQWYNNGYTSDSTNYDANPAVHVSWYNDGAVSAAGRLNMPGMKTGKWQYFHHNGKMSAEEVYEEGKLVTLKYFSENGSPVADTANKNRQAMFPGGVNAWLRYLEKNLYWPSGYKLVNTNIVAIGVEFNIDEEGNLSDIFLVTPFEDPFNDIVIRTLQRSPKWIPALSHNRKVQATHRQSISFRQIEY